MTFEGFPSFTPSMEKKMEGKRKKKIQTQSFPLHRMGVAHASFHPCPHLLLFYIFQALVYLNSLFLLLICGLNPIPSCILGPPSVLCFLVFPLTRSLSSYLRISHLKLSTSCSLLLAYPLVQPTLSILAGSISLPPTHSLSPKICLLSPQVTVFLLYPPLLHLPAPCCSSTERVGHPHLGWVKCSSWLLGLPTQLGFSDYSFSSFFSFYPFLKCWVLSWAHPSPFIASHASRSQIFTCPNASISLGPSAAL